MGGKTARRKAKPPKKELGEIVPQKKKSGESGFERVADLRDPWEGERQLRMPEKGEREPRGQGRIVKNEKLTNEEIVAKLRELKQRAEKNFKYHRGSVAGRPRGKKKEKKGTYLDRISRLGGIAGKRPGGKNPEVEKEEMMVFTEEDIKKAEEAEKAKKTKKST
ncbi:hypothetical protein GF412_00085 [Candidatus Micrarchaeota archaeon]|nr:hypothetical protein [Candidatus Micrarchaeota archaeon]MBD3417374.1 hypothetical protein [Candidatus Micrarchaeota archaeon]